MNIAAYGHKFFIFSGAILIAVAILQVLIRPKNKASDVEPSEGSPRSLAMGHLRPSRPAPHATGLRFIDATTIKAALFITVGILAILVGTGTLPMPSGR